MTRWALVWSFAYSGRRAYREPICNRRWWTLEKPSIWLTTTILFSAWTLIWSRHRRGMLHPLRGIWRWHRNAEGDHPPSVPLPLHSFILISNDLSIRMIEPVEYGRFLFWVNRDISTQKIWRWLAVSCLVLAVWSRCNCNNLFYPTIPNGASPWITN